jgi:hypothetical protein
MHRFSKEQVSFIKENVKGRTNRELTDMFNAQFELNLKQSQIENFKKDRRLRSGLNLADFNFKPGQQVSKGTQFKKGDIPANYKPIGSERIDRDGYTLVKVSDHKDWHKRWRHKHKVVWEKANGPIPKGCCVLFGDGNRLNYDLNNLIIVTRAQLAILNKHKLVQTDAELTRTGVLVADLYLKMNQKKDKQ